MTSRRFTALGLVTALVVAGMLSHYASSSPDGLMYVAATEGFLSTATDSITSGSPLAGYSVTGLSHVRLSGGLAGVIGCAVVFGLVSLVTRRRT